MTLGKEVVFEQRLRGKEVAWSGGLTSCAKARGRAIMISEQYIRHISPSLL